MLIIFVLMAAQYLILVFVIHVIHGVAALECLKCSDAKVETSGLNNAAKFFLRTFESTYRSPQCESASGPQASADVTLNTCTDNPKAGQVNRCGRMVGTLRIVIDPPLFDKFEVPINLHIRGCFIVEQTLVGGCYTDKSVIDKQRGVLSTLLGILSSAEIAQFEGKLCIDTPNNLDSWLNDGSSRIGSTSTLIWFCVWVLSLMVIL